MVLGINVVDPDGKSEPRLRLPGPRLLTRSRPVERRATISAIGSLYTEGLAYIHAVVFGAPCPSLCPRFSDADLSLLLGLRPARRPAIVR
jgi:hypothetical protein